MKNPDRAEAAARGSNLARRTRGDVQLLAQLVGLVTITEHMRPRTLIYVPPAAPGGVSGACLPSLAPADMRDAMLAVACGHHVAGTPHRVDYPNGAVLEANDYHRAAVAFARAFLAAGAADVRAAS